MKHVFRVSLRSLWQRAGVAALWVLVLAASSAHAGTWPHEEADVPPDPAVTYGKLENGFRYALMPATEPPKRVSMRLHVEAGSLMEDDDQRGLAHFLEHMAFNGTTHFAPGEMVEYFQRLGMAFGADTNAHTSFDETVYKIELPEGNAELLGEGMRLLRDYADGMLLTEEEIDKERGIILAEKRSRDSVSFRTFKEEFRFILPDARVSQRMPIGIESVIKEAPRERFVEFYEMWYTTDRLALVVVGEFDAEVVTAMIADTFGSLPVVAERTPRPDMGTISGDGVFAKFHAEPEASSTTVSIQAPEQSDGVFDSVAKRRENLTLALANAIINTRLEKLSKAEDAPFDKGVAYAWDWLGFLKMPGIEMNTTEEGWQASLAVAENELRKALEHGFTTSEVSVAKANMINSFEEAVKAAPTRKSRALANAISSNLGDREVFTSPDWDLAFAQETIAALDAESIHEVLVSAWSVPRRKLFLTGPFAMEDAEATILKTYEEAVRMPVEAPEQEEVAPFAYTDFGAAGEVIDERVIEDLEVAQYRFANNVRLNVKRTDFEQNSVSVQARIDGGSLALPSKLPGLGMLAQAIYTAGGLGEHSADDLKQVLAGRSVGLTFAVDDDAFVFSGGTTPDDLELQLQLLAAFISDPAFREEAYRIAQKQFDQLYTQLEKTEGGVMANEVANFLASGDSRFGFPERAELNSRTIDEVVAALHGPISHGYMEVSVVGDVDPEAVVTAVAKTVAAADFGVRHGEKLPYAAERKVAFPDVAEKTFTYASRLPKAVANVNWPTADMDDIHTARRLSMLAEVLDDRMRKKIREEIGEAYSPYSYADSSDVYDDYGRITAVIVADPEQAEMLGKLVVDIAADLAENGTDADELARMKEPRLNSIEQYVRQNRYWMGSVLAKSQAEPRRLDWARTMLDDYRAITVDEVNALAREYLNAGDAIRVLVLPEGE